MRHRLELVVDVKLWCHHYKAEDNYETDECLEYEAVPSCVSTIDELVYEITHESWYEEVVQIMNGLAIVLFNLFIVPLMSGQLHVWKCG
jgi:hypothetical protein